MANGGGPHGHEAAKAKKQPKAKGQPPAKVTKATSGKPSVKKKA